MISGLPEALRRHLEAAGARADVRIVSFSGRGSIHQAIVGRAGLRLPLRFEAELRPGRSFTWRATARMAGVWRIRLIEEYRSDRGRLAVGRRTLEGEGVDRAEYAVLWAWSLALAPAASARLTGVSWEPVDDVTLRVLYPRGTETWEATLRFDPSSGLLRRFETKRFELRAGFVRPWALELDNYRAIGGIAAPAALSMLWEDEEPLRLELEEAAVTPQ